MRKNPSEPDTFSLAKALERFGRMTLRASFIRRHFFHESGGDPRQPAKDRICRGRGRDGVTDIFLITPSRDGPARSQIVSGRSAQETGRP
jgi:hypothetical protein